jgi:hypothetical protein
MAFYLNMISLPRRKDGMAEKSFFLYLIKLFTFCSQNSLLEKSLFDLNFFVLIIEINEAEFHMPEQHIAEYYFLWNEKRGYVGNISHSSVIFASCIPY